MRAKLVKESLNEISPATFKSAVGKTQEYDQYNRGYKLGQTFFNQFVGKPLMDGVIVEIGTIKSSGDFWVQIIVHRKDDQKQRQERQQQIIINYSIDNDNYNFTEDEIISRSDARILSLIAQKINPETQYKDINKSFKVKYSAK